MSKFLINLSEADRGLIEAYRVKRGHKATAVAVRELIAIGIEVAGEGMADKVAADLVGSLK